MVVVNPRFACNITPAAGGKIIVVKGLAAATVRMDREKPCDECELEFPRHRLLTLDTFAPGDIVGLALGYKELGLAAVFEGPIKEVGPNLPLKITAESHGAATRKGPYKTTYQNKTWPDIAKDAFAKAGLAGVLSPYPAPTKPPKNFRVDGQTPAEVLERCAEETGWVWYVIPGTTSGWFGPRWEEPAGEGRVFKFIVGQNVFADNCQLEFVKESRVKRVVVTLTDADYEAAPATGEYKDPTYKEGDAEKKLSFAVGSPATKDADERAREEFFKCAGSGWRGSFTAVGNPYVRPGSRIAVANPALDDNVRHATVAAAEHRLTDGEYTMTVTLPDGGGAEA